MYSKLWSTQRLRQGDIIGPILLPLVTNQLTVVATAQALTAPMPEQGFSQVILKGESRLAAVVSHDCEFNEAKRNKLLIARIQDVPGNLSLEEREKLRLSNDVEAVLAKDSDATIAGVDSFVLAPIPGVFDDERVVVFTTITALPMKMKDDLLATKRAEMLQDDRIRLRRKLAWFFGRGGDDVPESEKSEPPPAIPQN